MNTRHNCCAQRSPPPCSPRHRFSPRIRHDRNRNHRIVQRAEGSPRRSLQRGGRFGRSGRRPGDQPARRRRPHVSQTTTTTTTNPDGTTTTTTSTSNVVIENPNGPMGWGEVDKALGIAEKLVDGGKFENLEDALAGSADITNPDGTMIEGSTGILQLRAEGMGWGQIARNTTSARLRDRQWQGIARYRGRWRVTTAQPVPTAGKVAGGSERGAKRSARRRRSVRQGRARRRRSNASPRSNVPIAPIASSASSARPSQNGLSVRSVRRSRNAAAVQAARCYSTTGATAPVVLSSTRISMKRLHFSARRCCASAPPRPKTVSGSASAPTTAAVTTAATSPPISRRCPGREIQSGDWTWERACRGCASMAISACCPGSAMSATAIRRVAAAATAATTATAARAHHRDRKSYCFRAAGTCDWRRPTPSTPAARSAST